MYVSLGLRAASPYETLHTSRNPKPQAYAPTEPKNQHAAFLSFANSGSLRTVNCGSSQNSKMSSRALECLQVDRGLDIVKKRRREILVKLD